MMVGKIALGVFLGNLAFAVLVWIGFIVATAGESREAAVQAQREYQSLKASSSAAGGTNIQ